MNLFSYVLGYSRRQYLRFMETQDFATTIREHMRAFEYLGGVAATCLYDNMKVVVGRYEDDQPIYNTAVPGLRHALRLPAGGLPAAAAPNERQGGTAVSLRGNKLAQRPRTFQSLDHLNEVHAAWLAEVADVRVHRETKRRPLDLHAEEQPHLLPLPGQALRHGRGGVPHGRCRRLRRLPPESLLGALAIYRPGAAGADHRGRGDRLRTGPEKNSPGTGCCPAASARQRRYSRNIARRTTAASKTNSCSRASRNSGPLAGRFLEGLVAAHRHGKDQAHKILALLGPITGTTCWRPWSGPCVRGVLALGGGADPGRPGPAEDAPGDAGRPGARTPAAHCWRNPVPPRTHGRIPKSLFEEPADGEETTPSNQKPNHRPQIPTPAKLRDRILENFRTLRIPLTDEQFDAALARAEREGLSHLEFLEALIAEQADQRRERSIERRIREACFRDSGTLETFDWKFNAAAIDRVQIEELATGEFIRRGDNLVMVGQSGVGKSHLIQAVGRRL